MEPIIVNTELSFRRYYNINLYILVRRKPLWVIFGICFLVLIALYLVDKADNTYLYLLMFYFLYALLMPVFVYFGAKRNYKKIKQMSEPKVYEFTQEGIKLTSETVKMEIAWPAIDKAVKRKEDFLLFSSNNRNFFSLPADGFTDEGQIGSFETLVKKKVAKRNF